MVGSRTLPAVCFRAAGLDCPNAWRQHLRTLATLSAASSASGTRSTEGTHASTTSLGRWLAGAAAVGVGMTMMAAGGPFNASGEAPSPTAAAGEVANEQAMASQLHEWLSSQGADVSKIQIKPSQAGPGAGLGVYATAAAASPRPGTPWWAWLWPRRGGSASSSQQHAEAPVLAAFPLSAAITVRTACEDPQLGEQFSWMLDKHLLDERTAIMVYLLIERLRGDKSRYAPWIRCLPRSFDVPITYTETDLAALKGTALHGAAGTMSKRLRETWSRLEAPLAAVARDLGLPAPKWEDWVWAYCVFWSRGQSLAVPESGSASNALMRHSSSNGNGNGDKIPIHILDALVPGLDFCNHRFQPPPQCWWEVVVPERPKQAAADQGASSTSAPRPATTTTSSTDRPMVRLQLNAGATARPGDELFISYGDKSNEELLMLYGFALERNPQEHLMLYCPLPPQSEWDDIMWARVQLLQAYGLRPQFFLPHPDQVAPAAAAAAAKPQSAGRSGKAAKKTAPAAAPAATSTPSTVADQQAEDDANTPPLVLPSEVLDTLEVFVLNFQELAVRSKALQAKMEERRAAGAAGTPLPASTTTQHSPVLDLASLRSRFERMTGPELRHFLAAMGLRMATLTTFIRLLEMKVVDLEGPEGTGSLEQDEELLAGLASSSAEASNQGSSASPLQHQRRLHAALVYRMGQKQLARVWVVRAKGELRDMMALMRDMEGRQAALEREKKQ